jgi:hypothetical protein
VDGIRSSVETVRQDFSVGRALCLAEEKLKAAKGRKQAA